MSVSPTTFVIFDESDRLAAVKQASKQETVANRRKSFPPRMISGLISSAKNEMSARTNTHGTLTARPNRLLPRSIPLYQKALKDAAALDFDDLINRTVEYAAKPSQNSAAKWQQPVQVRHDR